MVKDNDIGGPDTCYVDAEDNDRVLKHTRRTTTPMRQTSLGRPMLQAKEK